MRFLLLFLLSLSAQATTYFVDPTPGAGSDGNSGTSTGSPWAHCPGALGFGGTGWPAHLVNGDKVIIKGGTQNNYILYITGTNFNGSSAFDSIVIQSGHLFSPQWGTGMAIIDSQFTRTIGAAIDGNAGAGTPHGVTLDGFEIRNIAPAGNAVGMGQGSACIEISGPCTHFTIRRCWLHDAFRSGDDIGHGMEGGQDGENNYIITDNHIGPNIGTKGIELIRMSTGVVSNNFIEGCGDHYLCAGRTTNVDVCNNFIWMGYSNGTNSPVHTSVGGITLSSAVAWDVWNNLIMAPTRSVPNSIVGFSSYENTISNRVVFNTIAFTGATGNDGPESPIMLQKQIADSAGDTNYYTIFQNNIAYKNANQDGNIQWCVVHPDYVAHEDVESNVFWGGVSTSENVMAYRPVGGSSDTISPLSSYGTPLNPPTTSHTYANNGQIDPGLNGGNLPTGVDGFYHPNTTYFMLSQTNSPTSAWIRTLNAIQGDSAHGYSHASTKFNTDIIGQPRTLWSIGAYEFQSFLPTITNVTMILK